MPNQEWLHDELQNAPPESVKPALRFDDLPRAEPAKRPKARRKGASPTQTRRKHGRGQRDMRFR